jgi:hypothetical protein
VEESVGGSIDGRIDGREHGIGKKSGPSNRERRSIEGPSNRVLVARCVAVEDRWTNPWEGGSIECEDAVHRMGVLVAGCVSIIHQWEYLLLVVSVSETRCRCSVRL